MASVPGWRRSADASLEEAAIWLYPLRWLLVCAAFGTALIGFAPALLVVHFAAALPAASLFVGACLLPFALWPMGALLLAAWFEPDAGSLGRRNAEFRSCPGRVQRALRATAAVALIGFATGPFVVFGVALT